MEADRLKDGSPLPTATAGWGAEIKPRSNDDLDDVFVDMCRVIGAHWTAGKQAGGGHYPKEMPLLLRSVSRVLSESNGGASGGYWVPMDVWARVVDKARVQDGPFSRCMVASTHTLQTKVPTPFRNAQNRQ